MRVFIASADNQGRIDGTLQANLLAHFPEIVTSQSAADVAIVVVSFFHDFKFNPKLHDITKPVVIIDFTELEWCYFDEKNDTQLFGKNTRDSRWLNPNWYPFCDWVRDHEPVLYLKRELLNRDESERVKPIEWPCCIADEGLVSEDDFNKRHIEVLNVWGYSSPSRPILHADIFRAMATRGIGVISEKDQFEGYFKNPCARTWASIYAPWYARRPMHDLLWMEMRAKITTSLFGCGRKCFRHSEITNSIMAKQIDGLAWSFPWTRDNAILLRPGHEFEDIEKATHRSDLYEIYTAAHANADRYRGKRYVDEYLTPIIEAALATADTFSRDYGGRS